MVRKSTQNCMTLASLTLVGAALLSGCGESTPPATGDNSSHESTAIVTLNPPVSDNGSEAANDTIPRAPFDPAFTEREGVVRVAGGPNTGGVQTAAAAEPGVDRGAPELLMAEIARLRAAPLDVVRQPKPGSPGEFIEVQLNPVQVETERSRRLYEILDLAVQVIGKTFANPEQEQIFNNAVVYLAETRMQLVFIGDEKQGDLLQEDAETLFRKDSSSFAAVEASFKLLQLTQMLAQQRSEDARWTIAFARQARLFAERFPQEDSRATVGLASAGRQCDQLAQTEEAKACYELLQQRYPETPFAKQSETVLRRLSLVGQKLVDFGGPTHEGGNINLEHYAGKPLLIVFWSSESAPFQQDLPIIQQTLEQVGAQQMNIVGVNLDTNEQALNQFLEIHDFSVPHIFYSDSSLRGMQNLVASYYGVSQVPTYWLVGADGVVLTVNAQANELAALLVAEQ